MHYKIDSFKPSHTSSSAALSSYIGLLDNALQQNNNKIVGVVSYHKMNIPGIECLVADNDVEMYALGSEILKKMPNHKQLGPNPDRITEGQFLMKIEQDHRVLMIITTQPVDLSFVKTHSLKFVAKEEKLAMA